jgi:hypothetical protein
VLSNYLSKHKAKELSSADLWHANLTSSKNGMVGDPGLLLKGLEDVRTLAEGLSRLLAWINKATIAI